MNTRFVQYQKEFVIILVSILMVTFGTQNISYAQDADPTITASVTTPLTEATLSGSIVTLTLNGRKFNDEYNVGRALSISGIDGVTFRSWDVERVSDTVATVPITFSGNIDTDTNLVFTVGAGAIAEYDGADLTAQVPVTSVAESLVATTEAPLTETTLSGSVVTLTLSGRPYDSSRYNIERALTISGIDGVTISRVTRVNDMQATISLAFSGNIDTDATLTFTVGTNAIVGYNQSLTVQVPVTSVAESLVATTEVPLTEATLSGSVVTLTLSGRSFVRYSSDIARTTTISGIDGVTREVRRVSDTQVTITLTFSGNIDVDSTLTFTVGEGAINNYNQSLTVQVPVTAVAESLVATTEAPLTEATLHGTVVTLTLSGRNFTSRESDIRDALSVTGIEGFLSVDTVWLV